MRAPATRINWEGVIPAILTPALIAASGAMKMDHATWKTVAIAAASAGMAALAGVLTPSRRVR